MISGQNLRIGLPEFELHRELQGSSHNDRFVKPRHDWNRYLNRMFVQELRVAVQRRKFRHRIRQNDVDRFTSHDDSPTRRHRRRPRLPNPRRLSRHSPIPRLH